MILHARPSEETPSRGKNEPEDAREGIRQGLEDVAEGRTRPAREVLSKFRLKNGIPR